MSDPNRKPGDVWDPNSLGTKGEYEGRANTSRQQEQQPRQSGYQPPSPGQQWIAHERWMSDPNRKPGDVWDPNSLGTKGEYEGRANTSRQQEQQPRQSGYQPPSPGQQWIAHERWMSDPNRKPGDVWDPNSLGTKGEYEGRANTSRQQEQTPSFTDFGGTPQATDMFIGTMQAPTFAQPSADELATSYMGSIQYELDKSRYLLDENYATRKNEFAEQINNLTQQFNQLSATTRRSIGRITKCIRTISIWRTATTISAIKGYCLV